MTDKTPLSVLKRKLHQLANPERAAGSLRFFKTGPGEYGEGDQFLGVSVPEVRALLPLSDALSEDEVVTLLRSEWHEERLLALLALGRRFAKAKKQPLVQVQIVKRYLANTRWVNNWDLVDSSAPQILGAWLLDQQDRTVLRELASTKILWEERIAVVATLALIRAGEFKDTLWLCQHFLRHPHDLMHKACGWMLREVGKRDESTLRDFLNQHAAKMPRTMLRYAIEKFSPAERREFLNR